MVGDPVSGSPVSRNPVRGSRGGGRNPQELIRLAAGAEEVGLAVMLADLIRQNLEQNPGKWADFDRLDARICLEAHDADVTVTLEFARGTLVIHGRCGAPAIHISATAEALLSLPVVRIVAGLPHLFGPHGRRLRRGLLTGNVRISGIFLRPIQLIRFTRLMSVNG